MGRFVSRGGEKLEGALSSLRLDVAGLRALDAGAATGGFTDCLLDHGAISVVAVDVAYGQFAWKLRNDPRVRVVERTNIRNLTAEGIGGPVDLVVADLSFISLSAVADVLVSITVEGGRLLVMVKPQFELPKDRVPRGGVVRASGDWKAAACAVAEAYRARGCVLTGAAPSPLTGPKGNREFFLLFDRGGIDVSDAVIDAAVEAAP